MRRFWLSMLLLAVIGGGLASVGYFSGASTSLYIDRAGLHLGNENTTQSTSGSLEAFTDIEIEVASAHIKLVPSDFYGVEINSRESLPITYTNNNGMLKIHQNTHMNWQLFNMDFSEDLITVYYPANQSLGDIQLSTGSGKIDIDYVSCQSLRLSLASGNTYITKANAREISIDSASGDITLTDCQADQLSFSLVSGTLTTEGLHSNGLSANLTSGKATLNGQFLGNNRIDLVSGDVDMQIDGGEQDYSRSISVLSGTVTVNGVKNHANVTAATQNSLNISLTSGNVNIRFAP